MSVLLLFVKHPKPGQVKTRLARDVGHEKAIAVYRALLTYTREVSFQVRADKIVYYGNEVPEDDLWSEVGYERRIQTGADLGDRMLEAFVTAFEAGADKVVIVGSDCAEITSDLINQAFKCLDTKDCIVGPAYDGGYYLLGMRKLFSPVFLNKEWSTDSVLVDTIRDLKTGGLTYSFLPTLSDVDTVEDLQGTFLEEIEQKV